MVNAKTKTVEKSTTKSRATKKNSIVSSNVASFVNQATYQQRVQEKAYELFLKRGGVAGNELNDWFEAEKIIASQSK